MDLDYISIASAFATVDTTLQSLIKKIKEKAQQAPFDSEYLYEIDLKMSKKLYLSTGGSIRNYSIDGKPLGYIESEAAIALIYEDYTKIDIKDKVRKSPNEFCFMPITDGKDVCFTISKYSEALREYIDPNAKDINVVYTFDSMLVRINENGKITSYLFYIGQMSMNSILKAFSINPPIGTDPFKDYLYVATQNSKSNIICIGERRKAFYHLREQLKITNFFKTTLFKYSLYSNFDTNNQSLPLLKGFACKVAFGYIAQKKEDFLKNLNITENEFNQLIRYPKEKIPGVDLALDDLCKRLDIPDKLTLNFFKKGELLTEVQYEDIPNV